MLADTSGALLELEQPTIAPAIIAIPATAHTFALNILTISPSGKERCNSIAVSCTLMRRKFHETFLLAYTDSLLPIRFCRFRRRWRPSLAHRSLRAGSFDRSCDLRTKHSDL